MALLITALPQVLSWLKTRRANKDPSYRPLLVPNTLEDESYSYTEDIRRVSELQLSSYGSIVSNAKKDNTAPTKEIWKVITVVRSTSERLRVATELVVCALMLLISVFALHTHDISNEFSHSSALLAQAVFWAYAFALILLRFTLIRGPHPPKIGLWRNSTTIYLFAWIFTFPNFRSSLIHPYSTLSKWFHVLQFVLTTVLFVCNFSSKLGDQPVKLYTRGEFHPSLEPISSLFQQITYNWIDPLIWKGYWTSLQNSDIWELRHDDRARSVLDAYRSVQTPFGVAIRMGIYFRPFLIVSGFWGIVDALAKFGPPFLMKQILEYVQDPSKTPANVAWLFVAGMLFSGVFSNIASGQSLFIGRRICIRIRAIIVGEVYSKALRRKSRAVKEKDLGSNDKKDMDSKQDGKAESSDDKVDKKDNAEEGQAKQGAIINLMAVDAFKVSEICGYLHFFVSAILTIILAIVFLYMIIGWSAFVGALVAVVMLPVNYKFATLFSGYQKNLMTTTDERVNKLNELLQSIRIVKYFAWEDKFSDSVKEVRRKEIAILRQRALGWALAGTVYVMSPLFITVVSFSTYTIIQGHVLTAPVAFTSLALFNLMRNPMGELANMLNSLLQGKVAIDRVEEFLKESETSKYTQLENSTRQLNSPIIGFENATFSWVSSDASANHSNDFKLRDLNVDFKVGKLNIVIGPTGSGKTSLLQALLGEMELVEGQVFLPSPRNRYDVSPDLRTGLAETVAYCAQQAWLLNDTIRNNITFGSEFNETRYQAVVDACALKRDLEILDAGDLTEIGEKGITLSGGQKQRISLARAIYSNSRHLLLDDCLSAVDSHTALAIYEKALSGTLCSGRTVILVSHNVPLTISRASYVVAMDNGRIKGYGSPSELGAQGILTPEDLATSSATASSSATRAASTEDLQEHAAPSASLLVAKISTIDADSTDISEDEESGRVKTDGKLMDEETKADGQVKPKIYVTYMKAVGGVPFWISLLVLFIVCEWMTIGQSYWIKVWTSQMAGTIEAFSATFFAKTSIFENHASFAYTNTFLLMDNTTEVLTATTEPSVHSPAYYLSIYALVGITSTFMGAYKDIVGYFGGVNAAQKLFEEMLDSVLHAKVRFFDSTPIGRIMNRFSKDVESIDQDLAPIAFGVFEYILSIISITVLISFITPGFLIGAVFIGALYWAIAAFYIASSRELKRLDSVSKSPIFQHFGETLSGVSTIRAYGITDRFIQENLDKIDANNRPFFYMWVSNRWLSFRIDFAGALVSFCASTMIILSVNRLNAGLAGLSLSYAITFSQNVLWTVRFWAIMEMNMNSVERVQEYMEIEQEAPAVIPDSRPPVNWPSRGEIEVQNLSLRYAPKLPLVIKDISFKVDSFNKIGIVGRTGAGKSTIITAFFRFLEADAGFIKIDGVDIAKIGLKDLRENLAIIPQDPTLFTGTIRSNLDPFGLYSDAAIFEALRRVQLIKSQETSEENSGENSNQFLNLENHVAEGGGNLSQGQRQLTCLARSLLKSPKVLLLDEATASIDYDSDAQIQKTIREEFGQTTILTIAHRLKSIVDYDKILVMDNGERVEYDHPHILLEDKNSIFYAMCEKSGELETLLSIAEKAYFLKK